MNYHIFTLITLNYFVFHLAWFGLRSWFWVILQQIILFLFIRLPRLCLNLCWFFIKQNALIFELLSENSNDAYSSHFQAKTPIFRGIVSTTVHTTDVFKILGGVGEPAGSMSYSCYLPNNRVCCWLGGISPQSPLSYHLIFSLSC